MTRVVLIDNYDSFSFNLYQQIGTILEDRGVADPVAAITVLRHDALTASAILDLDPSHIVLSPGPGAPRDAGVCVELVTLAAGRVPLFGVCLGHQAICEAYGAVVGHARELVHGKASPCRLDPAERLFAGLPEVVSVARYHSLAVVPETLPAVLRPTAWADDGEIMAVSHRADPVFGVQFHPESILTPSGDAIMANFLALG